MRCHCACRDFARRRLARASRLRERLLRGWLAASCLALVAMPATGGAARAGERVCVPEPDGARQTHHGVAVRAKCRPVIFPNPAAVEAWRHGGPYWYGERPHYIDDVSNSIGGVCPVCLLFGALADDAGRHYGR